MNTKFIWLSILAVILSFVGGFMIANSLNRNDLTRLQAENENLKKQTTGEQNPDNTLSENEIKERIAEADNNPKNFKFQKNLGIGLYRYASFKKDGDLMKEISRILIRANELEPKDYEVLVTLGNLNFDIGYFKGENDKFEKAREYYLEALSQKPDDASVRTEYGLTFFLSKPPDIDKAISELERSLQENPKLERTLQVLIEAYLKKGRVEDAKKLLTKLTELNPENETLDTLKSLVSKAKNGKENQ
jgi:tetratricopeptide (TPR) repeat protein